MKRVAALLVVIVLILSLAIYFKLREQRLQAARPPGGSATIEGTEINVTARIPARVREIRAKEGGQVKAGDVLVVLDCTEQEATLGQAEAAVAASLLQIEGAKLSLARAEKGVDTASRQARAARAAAQALQAQKEALAVQTAAAQRASARMETVHAEGALSEQAFDRAQTEAGSLEKQLSAVAANVQGANAQADAVANGEDTATIQVRLARIKAEAAGKELIAAEAAMTRAAAVVAECTLKAPRAGYVQTIVLEPGEAVLPGARILTIVDVSTVTATFYLPNAELGKVIVGQSMDVVADAYPDRRFSGTVSHIATTAEFTPRNIQTRGDRDRLVYAVEVEMANPDAALRPGMPVEITAKAAGAAGAKTEAKAGLDTKAEVER
ncbi:MAG: efflux RND transporter periplasmic adaptor subunit [Pseudomonadota bacterium]